MENIALPNTPPYLFQRELPSGYLCNTGLFLNTDTKRYYICKSYPLQIFRNSDKLQQFKERLDHISLVKNPHIIGSQHVIEKDGKLLVFRDYIDQPPITEMFNNNLKINQNVIYEQWKIIVQSILLLHKHHIFPNSIRPSNIFIINSKIYITDLCMSSLDVNQLICTQYPFYQAFLAPEFFTLKDPLSDKSDLWSLGTLLYFMITKTLPWNTKNFFNMLKQITNHDFDISNDIMVEAKETILDLLKINQEERLISLKPLHESCQVPFNNDNIINSGASPRLASGRLANTGFLLIKDSKKISNSGFHQQLIVRTRDINKDVEKNLKRRTSLVFN